LLQIIRDWSETAFGPLRKLRENPKECLVGEGPIPPDFGTKAGICVVLDDAERRQVAGRKMHPCATFSC
jgi:hypothetical protein